ncbi:MAG: glucose-1-phosphate cytidylyltransferase [Bdellovibrionota bacterium]
MKAVILCGGKGTRLSEETNLRPKPMVEIGGIPMLVHIMESYAKYGYKEFVLALGYKGDYIKNYFQGFFARTNDFTLDLKSGSIEYLNQSRKDWKISFIDTGEESMTGGRLLRLKDHLKNEKTFMLTYGDGVSNINIEELVKFHKSHGKYATVSAVRPVARFGEMSMSQNLVTAFAEKPQTEAGWINGGFFVFNSEVFKFLDQGDETILERSPLENLTKEKQLMAYQHDGHWQCMDTLRDKEYLENLWQNKKAFWI